MKKIVFAAAIAAFSGIIFLESLSGGGLHASSQPTIALTSADTVPSRQKDTLWNKKKYPDTTHMPKRDSSRRQD